MELRQPPPRLSFRQTLPKEGGQHTLQGVLGEPENVGAKETPGPRVGEGKHSWLGVGGGAVLKPWIWGADIRLSSEFTEMEPKPLVTDGHPRAGLCPSTSLLWEESRR